MDSGYLQSRRDASCDEGSGDEVLGYFSVEVEGPTCDGKWWGDDGADHGEGVLEAEEEGEQDGDLIVEAVERRFVVLVLAVQWPDVGGDEVEVVL